MPYFSARCIKSAIESVFSVESLSGVPDEIPSRKASFVFCMSVVSIKKSLVSWKDITRNFEFENEEEKNSGKEGEGQNNNLILKKQLQNTNIISIRKVYLMVWCIELNWKSDQLRIKNLCIRLSPRSPQRSVRRRSCFFVEIVLIYKYKVDVCNALTMIRHSLI